MSLSRSNFRGCRIGFSDADAWAREESVVAGVVILYSVAEVVGG